MFQNEALNFKWSYFFQNKYFEANEFLLNIASEIVYHVQKVNLEHMHMVILHTCHDVLAS